MKTFTVGVIGCGNIGTSAHIPSYMNNPHAKIKYFCDIIPERAEAQVEKYGVGQAVIDYHDVLADDEVDIISVCTPNDVHSVITRDAIKAGKDVLCEKPAAKNLDEALTMLEAKRNSDRLLSIGVVNRFNTQVNKIRKMIQAGKLGEVYHVYISFRAHRSIPGLGGPFTTKSIAGGGVLIDWGVHYLDIVMYCLNDPKPLTASAETFSKLGQKMEDYTYVSMWAEPDKIEGTYDVEESIAGLIRTDSATFTLNGAWAQNIGENDTFIDFMGTEGGIRLQYGGDFTFYSTEDGMLTKTEYSMKTTPHFQNEINAFLEACDAREENQASIELNILTSKIMQALYDSAEKHEEVKID